MHLFNQRGKKKSCLHQSTYQHLKAACSFYLCLYCRERKTSINIDWSMHPWDYLSSHCNFQECIEVVKVLAENSMPFLFSAWTIRYIYIGKITCTCWKQLYFNKLHCTRFVWIVACRIILFWVGGCCFVKRPINTFLYDFFSTLLFRILRLRTVKMVAE